MNDSTKSHPAPGGPPGPGQTGVDRRRFLVAAGAVLGGSLVASRLGVEGTALAHEAGHSGPEIWAATRHDGRYVGLSGNGAAPEIRELVVGSDGTVSLGPTAGTLPDGYAALAVLSVAGRLLVAGATPYHLFGVPSLRPALYDATGSAELPLSAGVPTGFGAATAITAAGPRRLAVTVEGSDQAEQQYNATTWAATSTDGGRTWNADVLAADLGEGFPSHITAAGDRIFAVTVDGAGRRQGHQRDPGGGWRQVPADPAEGSLLAVHAARGAAFELVDRSPEGAVRRFRRAPADTAWQAAGTVEIGERILAVIPVGGAPGEFLAIGDSRAHLVGHV